jgi:FkbM family methyltransferase
LFVRRTTALYVGGNRVLVKTAAGLKMFVDSRDLSIAPHIMLDGVWEESTEAVLRNLIRPGMTVFEIGANVGFFTLLLSHLVGDRGRVIAFEADPDLAQIVRDNIELNGFHRRTRVFAEAISDGAAGEVIFHRALRHRGNGSLLPIEQTPHNPEGVRETITVPATSLDRICARLDRTVPHALKIDAEGAEPAILRGAAETLASPLLRILMLEFAPSFLKSAGEDPRAYLERIKRAGFRLHRIDARKRRMEAASVAALLKSEIVEIVGLRS